LRRFTKFARSSKYIFQADIRKYFPSIDHQILQQFEIKRGTKMVNFKDVKKRK